MKNLMLLMLLMFMVLTINYACAAGSKLPEYKDMKKRSLERSLFKFDPDGKTVYVTDCKRWKHDDTCDKKDEEVIRMTTVEAYQKGMVIIRLDNLYEYLNEL